MWNIGDIEAIPVELDFTSSGQGRLSATAIRADNTLIFNAIELVKVEPTSTQVEVCECCGIPRCSAGGWVVFRRICDRVAWIPAWDEMGEGAWEESEYKPPSFMQSQGFPLFSLKSWEELRGLHKGLPAFDDLPWISSREAARLSQSSAPGDALGTYPHQPRLRRDLLIAVTDGELAVDAGIVDAFLQEHFENNEPMSAVPLEAMPRPIEFWLDLPGIPGWKSFAEVENTVCLLIDSKTALVRKSRLPHRCI